MHPYRSSLKQSFSLFSQAPPRLCFLWALLAILLAPGAAWAAGGKSPSVEISVSPGHLSFGTLALGQVAQQSVTLLNPSTTKIKITSLELQGAGFSLDPVALPLTLGGRQSRTLTVRWAPTVAGNQSGSLRIVSNASNSPATVFLSGSAFLPATGTLTILPASVTFTNVTVGSTSESAILLTNSGSAALSILQVSASGPGFAGSGLALPFTLAAGQSTVLVATFTPSAAGTVNGSLTITSDAVNSSTTAALSGTAVLPTPGQVRITWDPSTSPVVGYHIYRGLQAGNYTRITATAVAGTVFTDSGVVSGQTYYYAVTALDAYGIESNFSNELSVKAP